MLKTLYQVAVIIALTVGATWLGYTEMTRVEALNTIKSEKALLDREMTRVIAVHKAQAYAGPVIEMATELARENMMFMGVVDQARATVAAQTQELNQTREALNSSMELMQDLIEDNKRLVDCIRDLEEYIKTLMDKIPDADCPPRPRILEEEEEL